MDSKGTDYQTFSLSTVLKGTATAIENNESTIISVQDNDDVNNIKEPVYVRWDILFRNYILSILFIGMAIGGSITRSSWYHHRHRNVIKYNKPILLMAFIHFACESSMSLHFLYSRKVAYKLSIVLWSLCILEGCIALYLGESKIILALFQLQFMASDVFSIMSSLCVLYNKAVPVKLKQLAFAMSLHFIGVSLEMYALPHRRGHGVGLVWLFVASIAQIYLCQNVLKGELNDVVSEVSSNEQNSSKWFIYFTQFCVPLLAFLVFPVVVIVGVPFPSTVGVLFHNIKRHVATFATGHSVKLAGAIFWPICIFNMLWIAYIWTNSHPLKKKEQKN